MSTFPPVVIREVGLRDGLQSIARVLPTERKLEWIRDAWAAGQREIEVGSFAPGLITTWTIAAGSTTTTKCTGDLDTSPYLLLSWTGRHAVAILLTITN